MTAAGRAKSDPIAYYNIYDGCFRTTTTHRRKPFNQQPVNHPLTVGAKKQHQKRLDPIFFTHGGLAEALLLVAPGGVGQVGGVLALDGDVVLQGDVADLDVIEGPA